MPPRSRLVPQGSFSLASARSFLDRFTPAGRPDPAGTSTREDLVLAFLTDDWDAAAVRLRETEKSVLADVIGGSADPTVLRHQVARMLSIDVDGGPFDAIEDPVIGELRRQYPGLRPVLFPTPYEAACWAVLSQRTRMSHAAAMRRDLAAQHGARFVVDGLEYFTFPPPTRVAHLRRLEGAPATKLRRLQAVAQAALDGLFDPGALRGRDPDDASKALQQIDGIGPFGAELIVVRGAGAPDAFPRHEPRLLQAMSMVYGLDHAEPTLLDEIAEGWRPRRAWASFLIRSKVGHRGDRRD